MQLQPKSSEELLVTVERVNMFRASPHSRGSKTKPIEGCVTRLSPKFNTHHITLWIEMIGALQPLDANVQRECNGVNLYIPQQAMSGCVPVSNGFGISHHGH